MTDPSKPVLRFGPFRLDRNEQMLHRGDVPVPLTPKAFELLSLLVEQRSRLVRKEEILAAIWPDTFVEEAVLSVNVSTIRKALEDEGHTYIETVPRRGYRFIAPVSETGHTTVSGAPWGARRRVLIGGAIAAAILLVAVPVTIYRLAPGRAHVTAVAVLPLDNLSTNPEQAHFADAMTQGLVTRLGQIPELRVISRESTAQYKETTKRLPEIARELRVKYVAQGTVSRDGDHVRVTAQLIEGQTDRQVWAQSYERNLRGAFALQSEIAEAIAREIGVTIRPPTASARSAPQISADAYEAYLRGNYLLDAGQTRAAIDELRKAVAISPTFAAAYARIASSYFGFGFYGGMAPNEAYPNMKEAALKAIEIDSTNAEAHAALALVKLHYDWDWAGADREFQRALQLNPSDADARHLYAHYLLTVGRLDESLTEMDHAFDIDPVGVGTAT